MQTKTDLFYGDKVLGESLSTPGYAMDALNAWNGATQTIGMEAGRVLLGNIEIIDNCAPDQTISSALEKAVEIKIDTGEQELPDAKTFPKMR